MLFPTYMYTFEFTYFLLPSVAAEMPANNSLPDISAHHCRAKMPLSLLRRHQINFMVYLPKGHFFRTGHPGLFLFLFFISLLHSTTSIVQFASVSEVFSKALSCFNVCISSEKMRRFRVRSLYCSPNQNE